MRNIEIMKQLIVIAISAFLFAACGNSPQPVANTNTNAAATPASNTDSLVISSHKSETKPVTDSKPQSTSGGSPNQRPADIKAQTAAIEKAEKEFKAKPKDEAAKKALAKAYFDRAFTLTEAAQYSAALGDFRKGLKLDPSDTKAKEMHDQIVEIYGMLGKEVPKEGQEMAPDGGDKPKQ